jgi:hypothetical protein
MFHASLNPERRSPLISAKHWPVEKVELDLKICLDSVGQARIFIDAFVLLGANQAVALAKASTVVGNDLTAYLMSRLINLGRC